MKTLVPVGFVSLSLLALGGCASTGSTEELSRARAAYAVAASGPAAQLADAELRLAKAALDDAEMATGRGREDLASDKGYIALRRVQIAQVQGELRQQERRREAALRKLAAARGIRYEEAAASLGMATRELENAQLEGQLTAAQLEEQRQRTAMTEQELSTTRQQGQLTQQQLEAERQARMQAEEKARQAMAELGRLAAVKEEARGIVITLSGAVLFASNQSTLLPAATRALDSVVTALQATPDRNATVEGHTDAQGSRAHNMQLAQRRAEAVRTYLVSRGIRPESISARGIGPDQAVATNATPEGRANNRRVEIIIAPLQRQAPAASAAPAIPPPASSAVGPAAPGAPAAPGVPAAPLPAPAPRAPGSVPGAQ